MNEPSKIILYTTPNGAMHVEVRLSGKTAAERILDGVDATKHAMGLTTWKHAPHSSPLRSRGRLTCATQRASILR